MNKKNRIATPEKIELAKKYLREGWSFLLACSKAGLSEGFAYKLLNHDVELKELHQEKKRQTDANRVIHWWPEHVEKYKQNFTHFEPEQIKNILPIGCKNYSKNKKI